MGARLAQEQCGVECSEDGELNSPNHEVIQPSMKAKKQSRPKKIGCPRRMCESCS